MWMNFAELFIPMAFWLARWGAQLIGTRLTFDPSKMSSSPPIMRSNRRRTLKRSVGCFWIWSNYKLYLRAPSLTACPNDWSHLPDDRYSFTNDVVGIHFECKCFR